MTTTPSTPQELLDMNSQEPTTPESLFDQWVEMDYQDQDNFIYQLLQSSLKFHEFLLDKSMKGDKSLPNTNRLVMDVTKLELICQLYQEVQ